MQKFILLVLLIFASSYSSCSKKSTGPSSSNPVPTDSSGTNDVSFWRTDRDQSVLLQQQPVTLSFNTKSNQYPFLDVDSTQKYQTIDGFGFTLTGGSASVINQMNATAKAALLK